MHESYLRRFGAFIKPPVAARAAFDRCRGLQGSTDCAASKVWPLPRTHSKTMSRILKTACCWCCSSQTTHGTLHSGYTYSLYSTRRTHTRAGGIMSGHAANSSTAGGTPQTPAPRPTRSSDEEVTTKLSE